MRKIVLSSVILVIFLMQSSVRSADAIAVVDFLEDGVSKSTALSLSDTLRVELGRTGKYSVMERAEMESVLREQGFQPGEPCDTVSCAVEMGKLLVVKYMVLGTIIKTGEMYYKTFTITIRLVEVETGKVVSKVVEIHKSYGEKNLIKRIPKASQKLAGTYKKKEMSGFTRAILVIGGVAIAVPIIRFMTPKESVGVVEDPKTGVKVIWGE